jgi:type IV pilus biogenesis protein CpaD/CtpE
MPTENTMASAILTSAKHGAYLAIGIYVAMVLVVSLSAQSQHDIQAPIQVAYPAIQFEHRAQSVVADHEDLLGAVGA